MIDSALDIVKFQIINSLFTISSHNMNFYNISFIVILYFFYKNRLVLFDYLYDRYNKTNHVIIEGKRHFSAQRCFSRYDELYSIRFRAIWYYVNNNISNLNIKSIKEFSNATGQYNDFGEECNSSNLNKPDSLFIVDQWSKFELFPDIYCKVHINDNHLSNNDSNTNTNKHVIENCIVLDIFSNKKSINEIDNHINIIVKEYEKSLKTSRKDKLFIYSLELKNNDYNSKDMYDNYNWTEIEFNSNKSFNNLFFEGKLNFLNRVNFFCNNEKFYNKNGIPYTLGISLEGPPGTGKTSIIKCLANYLNRHIVLINFNKIKTNQELNNCFYEDTYSNKNKKGSISYKEKIYVFEDLDCCMDIIKIRNSKKDNKKEFTYKSDDSESDENNENNEDNKLTKKEKLKFKNLIFKHDDNPDKLTLGHILNVIDGIKETPGRIIIISSNHIDSIDPALKRPGRIDLHVNMNYVNTNILKQMYLQYYDECLNVENENEFNEFEKYKITPAQITNVLINSEDKNEFIKNINNLINNKE